MQVTQILLVVVLEISQQMHINQISWVAGNQAINAYNSNFFGYNSGINASGANSSNFFGAYATISTSGAILQISLVVPLELINHSFKFFLKLVLVQQMRIIQISLVLKLNVATNADNSNFFG
jgi:hypothetical protein